MVVTKDMDHLSFLITKNYENRNNNDECNFYISLKGYSGSLNYYKEEKMKTPKYLYKYKGINSITDLSRILAIIRDSSIYMPTYDQLNDPLEGAGYSIGIPGWAGVSILEAADMELPPIEEMKKQYRILSLSQEPVSPQLWAHYSNNYNGVCLCFSTEGVFKEAQPVLYRQKRRKKAFTDRELIEAVHRGFFYKHLNP